MNMRLAISVTVIAYADGLRRFSSMSRSSSAMRNDLGPVVDQDSETHFGALSGRAGDRGSWRSRRRGWVPGEGFERQTAAAKMSQIWSQVTADTTPGPIPSAIHAVWSSLEMMAFDDFFERVSDVKPVGEAKVLHQQAVACQFSMRVRSSSPYTGIFAPGTTTGLVRMGPPLPNSERAGLSVKWFRSNVPSGNTVMAATDASRNFFEHDISNHIALFENAPLLVLRRILRQTMCSGATGLSDLAMYDQDGNSAGDNWNGPYELVFEPANRTLARMPAGGNHTDEVFRLLIALRPGTKLFNVKVRSRPGGSLEEIGEFNLASRCTTSRFADMRIQFHHVRMEEDLSRRPEWEAMVREFCDRQR